MHPSGRRSSAPAALHLSPLALVYGRRRQSVCFCLWRRTLAKLSQNVLNDGWNRLTFVYVKWSYGFISSRLVRRRRWFIYTSRRTQTKSDQRSSSALSSLTFLRKHSPRFAVIVLGFECLPRNIHNRRLFCLTRATGREEVSASAAQSHVHTDSAPNNTTSPPSLRDA